MSVQFMRVAAAAAAVLTLSAAGYADDADQANPDNKALLEYVKKLESRVNQLEQEKDWPLDQVRAAAPSALDSAVKSLNATGFIEMQYNVNFRHGGRSDAVDRGDTLDFNKLHANSNDENGFSFQTVQLMLEKPLTTVNSTGFRVRMQFGLVSKFDNRDANFTDPAHAFDVREAYMMRRMDGFGNAMDVSVGKFDSPLGFESPDNTTNWQVTRGPAEASLLPVTLTGVRAAMPWGDNAKTTLYLVNGWDVVRDTNDSKTIIVSQEFGKFDWLNSSLTFNLSWGDEGSIGAGTTEFSPAGNKTTLLEAIWRGQIDNNTQVAADAIWARQQNGALEPDFGGGAVAGFPITGGETGNPLKLAAFGTARGPRVVHMIEGYIKHQWSKDMWVSGRTGYYADSGFNATLGRNLRMYDVTFTLGWDLAEDLTMAIEYRHDHAMDTGPFGNESGHSYHGQDVVTASMLYRF